MLRVLKLVVASMLALYVTVCVLLFLLQRSLIYFPQPRTNVGDSVLLTLPSGGEEMHVSARLHAGTAAVVYFGGNAEDVSVAIPDLVEAFPGTAIYALHYPGYGGSEGKPTQQSIFAASLALFDRVRIEHPEVTVIGRSLGSGAAVWVASQRPTVRLVLVTPFDSLADAAAEQFRIIPVRWLVRDRFESGRYAPQVTAPTTIVVAGDDEVIPRTSSDRLRTRFRQGLVTYTVLPSLGHNEIQESPRYRPLLSGR